MKSTPSKISQKEMVVVLHGIGRTHRSMSRIARGLDGAGYRVVNRTYPSRTMPFEKIASVWLPELLRDHDSADAPRVHFVTYSMGGIVARLWLRECADRLPPNLGRIVMLAPPNQGSEVPDRLHGFPPFHWWAGVNGARLGTRGDSLPRTLSLGAFPEGTELGIIAGNRTINPLFSGWIGAESDGTVSVTSTRLAGMRDHIVMPHSHMGILTSAPAIAQAIHFLR